MPLTNPQHIRFCEEYLKDFNGTQAWMRAGYKCSEESARRQASKLLTKLDVQAYLSQKRKVHAQNAGISLERTLEEISRIAFSDVTDSVSFSDKGVTFKSSSALPKGVTSAIKKIRMDTTRTIRDGKEDSLDIEVRNKTIEQHDKVRALSLLAKYFGITSDFNQARAALLKYGLALEPDDDAPTGWRLERYAPDATPTADQANQAATEFTGDILDGEEE